MNPPFAAPSPGIIATPPAIATPAPTFSSERVLLRKGILDAGDRARAMGGVLGAVVIDFGSGAVGELNGDLSMPMQSVQKLLIALVTYGAVDRGTLSLDRSVTIDPADLVTHVSPIADQFATGRKSFRVDELLHAMLVDSDNTAAKALIRELGGIDAVNAAIRDLGFDSIVAGNDDDGVATPHAIARVLTELVDGRLLRATSRAELISTLSSVQTFPGRLRAGLPPGTKLAHKTGTSQTINGVTDATDDVGIVYLRGRTMIVVAMLQGAHGSDSERDAVLAAVARAAADAAASLNP